MPELSPVTVRAPLRAKSPGGEPPTSLTLKALGSLKAESTRGERGQSRLQPSVRGWRQQSHTPQHQPRARPDLHRGKGTARPGGGVDAGEGSPGPGRRVQGTGETACPLHVARQPPAPSLPPRRNRAAFLTRETDPRPGAGLGSPGTSWGGAAAGCGGGRPAGATEAPLRRGRVRPEAPGVGGDGGGWVK